MQSGRMAFTLLCLLAAAPAVQAQDIILTPSLDTRLRYEHVAQDGPTEEANGFTLRARPGFEARLGVISALIEAEGTLPLVDDYFDGLNQRTDLALVADPRNIEINRAQLKYAAGAATATAGRQRLALLDERFVGPAAFRQNEQTFDAARLQWSNGPLSTDLAYAWSVRTVNGTRGTGSRQEAVAGDNVFAVTSYRTDIGTFSAFAYLVDQDEAIVQGFRLSSQTYGLRFAGSIDAAPRVRLGYVASAARQSDWHRNPNEYAATYLLTEVSVTAGGLNAVLGREVLGADNGAPLTSVQTPLASFFRFNGWAGKFTMTPPNGLRDLYGTIGQTWSHAGPFDTLNIAVTAHRFTDDRLGQHYGDELDLVLAARRGQTTGSLRYATYRADNFATDTRKFWLTLEWTI